MQPARSDSLSVSRRKRSAWIDRLSADRSTEFDKLLRLICFVGANNCLDSIRVSEAQSELLRPRPCCACIIHKLLKAECIDNYLQLE